MSKRRPKPDRNEDGRARSLKKGRVEVEGKKKGKKRRKKKKGTRARGRPGPEGSAGLNLFFNRRCVLIGEK